MLEEIALLLLLIPGETVWITPSVFGEMYFIVENNVLTRISGDEYWLARTIYGEAYFKGGDAAAYLIADTIFNRIDYGWCDSIEGCALRWYYGVRSPWSAFPSQDAFRFAREALRTRETKRRYPIVYALSSEDVENLALSLEDASISVGPFHFFDQRVTEEFPILSAIR